MKIFLKYWFLIGMIIVCALMGIFYYQSLKEKQVIHIAFVGPMVGYGARAGKSMTRAIKLYIDTINQQGGVNGKKIVIDVFDDQNDPEQAKQKALEIADQNRAVAVIGHWYSSTSISAGEIYKRYAIPAITPGSTNINVTQDNEWYFRNIFNAKTSGKFIANYVKKVLRQNTVTLIHEDGAYGAYLAQVFEMEAKKLGMTVKYQWEFKVNDAHLPDTFQNIVEQLKTKTDAGVIFLAMQAIEGVQLVKLIKDANLKNTLISEASFSEETFVNGFQAFEKERANPGYYTNDIYVATPLIFDTANERALQFQESYQAKYQEKPDWAAAYAYDTVMVLTETLKKTQIHGKPETLKADRQKLRDYLANLTHIEDAFKGITGFNYFDDNRNSQKPVVIGVYKNNNLISALTQLQTIRNINEISDLETALQNEQVLLIDDRYMYKTNVVYTGIDINKMSELDLKNLTYTLDFNLWFRFRGHFNPKNIKFFNAVEPILLGEPQIETQGLMNYHVYHVKGSFRADFMSRRYAFNQHILGISFSHSDLNRNNLIYVTDVLGMGLNKKKSLLQRLQEHQVINPLLNWTIQKVWFFQDIIETSSLGRFNSLNLPDNTIKYSRFNMGIRIKKDEFALRGMISPQWAAHIIIFSCLLIFLVFIVEKNKKNFFPKWFSNNPESVFFWEKPGFFKKISLPIFTNLKYAQFNHEPVSLFNPNSEVTVNRVSFDYLIWLFQLLLTSILLLSMEVILVDQLADSVHYQPRFIITLFDVLWWLVPAMFINMAIKRFIWRPLEKRSGRSIPNVIRIVVTFIIYLLAGFGILAFVYEQALTSLLATSGMVAMIIGLAIQVNISNIFSGVVINLERPFRVGDWVKIGSFEEGIVIDVNWRTTRIKARNGHILSIPNGVAAESDIQNYNYTYGYYFLWPTVYVDPIHSPDFVQDVLKKAILAVEDGVLKNPEPYILFAGVNEWAASYWVVFAITNYQDRFTVLNQVWRNIWDHLERANILFAIQRQEVYLFQGQKERRKAAKEPPFQTEKG